MQHLRPLLLPLLAMTGFILATLLVGSGYGQAPPLNIWVGFRYDEMRVIAYVADMEDPIRIGMADVKDVKEKVPATRNSVCGYHLPLTEERLKTFKRISGTVLRIGQPFSVILDGGSTVSASVRDYVEEWHGDSIVRVAIIAEISPADRRRFQDTKSSYFLISTQSKPASPPLIPDPNPNLQVKTTRVLSRFGVLGDLIERTAEAGWEIRLFRPGQGTLRPTAVVDGCGD